MPVMPPSVCCESETGASTSIDKVKMNIENIEILRLLIILNLSPESQRDRGVGTNYSEFVSTNLETQLGPGFVSTALKQVELRVCKYKP